MTRILQILVKVITYTLMETVQELFQVKSLNENNKSDLTYKYSEKQNEHVDTFMVIPPDGGWGWVVVIGAFFAFLVGDGVIYTFGIFLFDISQTFNCSNSRVAATGAVMTGFFCLSGPFISALVNRFGYRKVSIAGSFIASLSCALTSISPSLFVMFLTYGVMGGFGFGLMYVPGMIAVGFYFERWRGLATGISVCGAGIGGITLPLVLSRCVREIGWRQTFRVISVLSLCCTFCGLLYRPLKPVLLYSSNIPKENENEQNEKRSFFIRFHNASHPTLADIHKSRTVILEHVNRTNPVIKVDAEGTSTVTIFKPQKLGTKVSSEFLISIPSDHSTSSKGSSKSVKVDKPEASTRNIDSRLSTVFEEKENDGKLLCGRFECRIMKNINCRKFFRSWYQHRNKFIGEKVVSRPLYRDDIFYSGSLEFLPEYRRSMCVSQSKITKTTSKSKSTLEYSMMVTRAVTHKELEETNTCSLCHESIKRTLATMLDFNLLKSPSFILLTMNAVFTSLGFYTPYMFIQDRAVQNGVPESSAFWLLSCIGFTNTLGRIICGLVSSFSKIRATNVSSASLFVGGFAMSLSGLSFNLWVQFGCAALYGISVACMTTLRTIIIVELLGLEKLTNAIGIILMFQGVASLAGTSISGFLKDLTGDYTMSFYFAGGCISAGSLLLIPIRRVSAWERQQRKEDNLNGNSDTKNFGV